MELFSSIRPFYFVTFNTHRRKKILAYSSIHQTFLTFVTRAAADHDVAVGRYVIMPDHIHLFVALPPDGPRLDSWVKALKTILGKTLVKMEIPKVHWQEGFFDHVLRSSESYSQKWAYIRQNPVRAGLVENADCWPWQGEFVRIEY